MSWMTVLLGAGLLFAAVARAADPADRPAFAPYSANPILPGYYADPSIVQHEGKIYIYATLDPWGGRTLGCWESTDWKNWTYRDLNWPTKEACTTPKSKNAMVWAPSVVHGPDGKFHMAVSVGSEVWAGVADSPTGPWKNALGEKKVWIPYDYKPGFHMIDAEYFVDTDGTPYLYWGSGFDWINGKCWAVKLKPDFVTFDGDVHDVTPANYFEGPYLYKHADRYHLMYSSGKTIEDTYQVHTAVGDSPFGPFKETAESPVLVTDAKNDIISPGHHAMFERDGKSYILYHRHSIPFDPKFIGRQMCADEVTFAADGSMQKVVPTHTCPAFLKNRYGDAKPLAATYSASSSLNVNTAAARAADDNYATRWAAGKDDKAAWLQMDLGRSQSINRQEIRVEYASKSYAFKVDASDDGQAWETVADHTKSPVHGSPIVIDSAVTARYLRLSFVETKDGPAASVWEWAAF